MAENGPERPENGAPPALDLVLACCSVPEGRGARIAAALKKAPGDATFWQTTLKIVARHRVSGLVFRALQNAELPPEVRQELSQRARQQTILVSRLTLETILVQRILRRAGVPVVFPKGAALSRRLYGDVAPRHTRDVDAFTSAAHIEAAHAAMLAEGYQQTSPARPFTSIRRMSDHHISYKHPQRKLLIELHWGFGENPALPPCPDVADEIVPGTDAEIATLGDTDLMCYLVLHGASHSWMRLKWLADMAELVPQISDLPALLETAEKRGLLRPMAQMLYLLRDLLGWQMPEAIAGKLPQDWAVQKLEAIAKRTLLAGGGLSEPRDQPFGTTRIYASRLLFSPRPAYLWHEIPHLLRFFFSADNTPGVPAVLRPVFFLIRIPHWLIRNLLRTR